MTPNAVADLRAALARECRTGTATQGPGAGRVAVDLDDAVDWLARTLDPLDLALVQLAQDGCTDHGCITHHHTGMGTNGGCGCLKQLARGGVGTIFACRIGQVLRRARALVGR